MYQICTGSRPMLSAWGRFLLSNGSLCYIAMTALFYFRVTATMRGFYLCGQLASLLMLTLKMAIARSAPPHHPCRDLTHWLEENGWVIVCLINYPHGIVGLGFVMVMSSGLDVVTWFIWSYSSGLLHWQRGNRPGAGEATLRDMGKIYSGPFY